MAAVPGGHSLASLGDREGRNRERGRLRVRGHQQSSVPEGRDNQMHPDKVVGAGLRCAGE